MSGRPYGQITKGDDVDRLISAASAMELTGRVELLRAVRRGEITLVEVRPPGHAAKPRAEGIDAADHRRHRGR